MTWRALIWWSVVAFATLNVRPALASDASCGAATFEGSHFTVCAARPGGDRIRLVDKGGDGQPLRSLERAAHQVDTGGKRIAFAMNAGMFDDMGLPIGLYVEQGVEAKQLNQRNGAGNFHLKPNGVFYGDAAGWHVLDTERFAAKRPRKLRFATQSGPMLVIDGKLHPAFSENGTSLQFRNGVGVDRDGVAWFAISDEPVSFGRFARLFRDHLDCRNAVYFDGAVSQLLAPDAGRDDRGVPLGPIVVVTRAH
jgi:uncharacterized protein YigE (DUF2233 family)